MDRILVVPGLNGSGSGHWQTWIEPLLGASRVTQADWTRPDIGRWSAQVLSSITGAGQPVWLIAHSFGCLASVAAARSVGDRIAGALLVAPASPDRFGISEGIPGSELGFPVVVAASRNDPWMDFMSAAAWADRWGARLVDLGNAGHVNTDSGHGPWPEGLALFQRLRSSAPPIAGNLHCS